jgi:hypothetical protein
MRWAQQMNQRETQQLPLRKRLKLQKQRKRRYASEQASFVMYEHELVCLLQLPAVVATGGRAVAEAASVRKVRAAAARVESSARKRLRGVMRVTAAPTDSSDDVEIGGGSWLVQEEHDASRAAAAAA